jgi:1,4-alpha-glucan branching enzyme
LVEDRREQFHAGTLSDGWRWFGAHSTGNGWRFRVWAPCAAAVSVVGDFNGWTAGKNQMTCRNGVWETEITGLRRFDVYKFAVEDRQGGIRFKADPYAFHAETRPATASKLYDLPEFPWSDADFCAARRENLAPNRPLNIYEVHLGSWKRRENGDFYDYRSMAEELAPMSGKWVTPRWSCCR